MSFYNAFTHGMTPVATEARPVWTFEARSAANKAYSVAAQHGDSPEMCHAAYLAAWETVEASYT